MWRFSRYQKGEFESMMKTAGKLSPLFKSPGLTLQHFMVDWLHAVDLGVLQIIIGNILWESLPMLFPALPQKEQVKLQWQKLSQWYKQNDAPSKLDALTVEMLKLPGKGPKLRSKAAECRYLLPYAHFIAHQASDDSPHWKMICMLADNFLELAITMSVEPYDFRKAATLSRMVSSLAVSLEAEALSKNDENSWRVKPKLHMMQELLEYIGPDLGDLGSARRFWTYKDERWGGFLSTMAMRRGGPKTAANVAQGLITRYRALAHLSEL
jgi:hypothetical protein